MKNSSIIKERSSQVSFSLSVVYERFIKVKGRIIIIIPVCVVFEWRGWMSECVGLKIKKLSIKKGGKIKN